MLRKLALIFLLCSLSTSLWAQEVEVRPGDFLYGFSGGANFGKLSVNGAEVVKSAAKPFIGLSASYALSHNWRANFAGYFSMRSSIVDNYYRMDQTGVDLQAFAQYKIDDLYLNFGVQSQTVVSYQANYRGNSNFRLTDELSEYTVPNYQLSPLVGIEIKLMDNWRVFTNYSFAIGGGYSNYQVGLTYRINKRNPPPESERSRKKRLANRQIKQLRDGALLVRLKTSKPTIAAMKKRGYHQLAEETEEEQRIENLSLMRAFQSAYHFSEVKFFYSEDSRKVLQKKYDGIFLNDSLQKDSAIILNNTKHVFTCELTNIEEDTARYFSHYELISTGNFAFKQVPRYYGGGQNTFYSLVIKDHQFNQLSRPFPYYSRALFKSMSEHPGHGIFYLPFRIFFADTPIGSVEGLNEKLYKYWQKAKIKSASE